MGISRARIRAKQDNVTRRSLSGSLEQVVGSLEWGPNFGKVDDSTMRAQSVFVLDDVGFTATLSVDNVVDLEAIDLVGSMNPNAILDLASIDLLGSLAAEAKIDFADLGLDGSFSASTLLDLADVEITGTLQPSAAIDLFKVDPDGALGVSTDQGMQVEVEDWICHGDTYLAENQPDTNFGSAPYVRARAQSTLASDREHGYFWWDVGGTFNFDPITVTGEVTGLAFFFAVTHDAGALNNPAQLFYEVYDGATTEPFDEDTATWNNSEGEHENAGYTLNSSGSIEIDNTDPPDYVDDLGQDKYIISFGTATANFRGEVESGDDWWLVRFLGDTRLGQDNVRFEIVAKELEGKGGDEVNGIPVYAHLDFTYTA